MIERLIDWEIDWLKDWLIERLIERLIDWLRDWLRDWLIERLIDWLRDWLIEVTLLKQVEARTHTHVQQKRVDVCTLFILPLVSSIIAGDHAVFSRGLNSEIDYKYTWILNTLIRKKIWCKARECILYFFEFDCKRSIPSNLNHAKICSPGTNQHWAMKIKLFNCLMIQLSLAFDGVWIHPWHVSSHYE